jgi:ubiquinone/menaquinone biosynthesis C-methylase UbiE
MSENSKQLSQERFGRYSEAYVSSKTHAQGEDLERLIAIAQPQADWQVLDVATGGGHTALKFAPFVRQVTATDITPRMLTNAEGFIRGQGVNNVDFEVMDAEDLQADDGAFDLVTCRIAPHHFPNAQQFVREAARVLKSGGLLLVQDQVVPDDVPTAETINGFEKLRDPSHNRAFTEAEWVAMFEAASLSVEHTEQLTKRHHLRKWAAVQECSPEVVVELLRMVENGSDAVRAWMQPLAWETEDATFVNHHVIVAGRKPRRTDRA